MTLESAAVPVGDKADGEAREMLKDPKMFDAIGKSFLTVNESDNILYIHLSIIERQSVEIRGESASGKGTIADEACSYLPSCWWIKVEGLSDKALRYLTDDLRLLYIAERRGLRSGGADDESNAEQDVKLMISEGVLRIPTVVKDPQSRLGYTTRFREVRIGSFLTTTTSEVSQPEYENRFHIINARDDRAQNEAVVDQILKDAATLPWERRDNSRMRMIVQRAYAIVDNEAPKEAVIPFSSLMKEGFDLSRAHVRRNIKKLIALVRASARLHFMQRSILLGKDGLPRAAIAVPEDLQNVLAVGNRALESTFSVMSQAAIETLRACQEIAESAERKEITTKTVFEELQKTRSLAEPTVYKRLQTLCKKGFLRADKITPETIAISNDNDSDESKKGKRSQARVIYVLVGSAAEVFRPLEELAKPDRLKAYHQATAAFVQKNQFSMRCTPNFENIWKESESTSDRLKEAIISLPPYIPEVGSTSHVSQSNSNQLSTKEPGVQQLSDPGGGQGDRGIPDTLPVIAGTHWKRIGEKLGWFLFCDECGEAITGNPSKAEDLIRGHREVAHWTNKGEAEQQ